MYIRVNIDTILFIYFDILNSSKRSLLSVQILMAEILFGRAAPTIVPLFTIWTLLGKRVLLPKGHPFAFHLMVKCQNSSKEFLLLFTAV